MAAVVSLEGVEAAMALGIGHAEAEKPPLSTGATSAHVAGCVGNRLSFFQLEPSQNWCAQTSAHVASWLAAANPFPLVLRLEAVLHWVRKGLRFGKCGGSCNSACLHLR